MKTIPYTRVNKPDTVALCSMHFNKNATVTLDFGKKQGGKLKLPIDFLADSIEHYLNYVLEIALDEIKGEKGCRSKKAQAKKR